MSAAMTRSELIAQLTQAVPDVPAPRVEEAVKCLLDTLIESLASGERIEIRGFGSFSLHVHPPRLARNPKTGERVAIGPRSKPHFKPGKELKNLVALARNMGCSSMPKPADEDLAAQGPKLRRNAGKDGEFPPSLPSFQRLRAPVASAQTAQASCSGQPRSARPSLRRPGRGHRWVP